METGRVGRNTSLYWFMPDDDSEIIVSLKDQAGFISLKGIDLWLWLSLSKPLTINELENRLRTDKKYCSYIDRFEESIDRLMERNVLCRIVPDKEAGEMSAAQRYKDKINILANELAAAKNFPGSNKLVSFHKGGIRTVDRHFEDLEATVSHLYREAHPALGGLSYGARLFHKLNSIKEIASCCNIVEVGGGLGFLARSFIDEFRRYDGGTRMPAYVFCELTFPFLKSQISINERNRVWYCQASAETMPFKDNSIDIIIDNENIADFTPVKLNKRMVLDFLKEKIGLADIGDSLVRKSLSWIRAGGIDVRDAMPEFIFNIGAVEFISEIKRTLKPGGIAFVSEYGSVKEYPKAVYLHGHVEYDIQFSHLLRIIEVLEMDVEILPLMDFLGFDKSVEVIDASTLTFLYDFMKERGFELPYLAYTKDMLNKRIPAHIDNLHNLQFNNIDVKSVFHNLHYFYVLLITNKPQ